MAKKIDYLPLSEVAEIFDLSVEYIEGLIDKRVVDHKKLEDGVILVDAYSLDKYLNHRAQFKKDRQPDRIKEMEDKVNKTNSLVRTIGNLFSDVIDSLAELGSMIPLAEIMVTIMAFYGAGLGEVYGLEVLVGLVFAQIAALYLTAHYRDTAMTKLGDAAIFTSIFIGAANTGIAVYLALASAEEGGTVARWVWYIPALSAGLSVLLMYVAKMFTHERASSRVHKRHESDAEMKELKREADASRKRAETLAEMQQVRLDMDADALNRLAQNPMIKQIQDQAMWMTLVADIMKQYNIRQNSKLGKELIALAQQGANGAEGEALPEPDVSDLVDDFLAQNQNRTNGQPTTNRVNGSH